MKRIAIFGGAFDPIHMDHLRLASEVLNFDFCDEVWLMPSPDRWDKKCHSQSIHRLEMCRLATQNLKNIQVSAFEESQNEYRGSYILLKELQTKYPDFQFSLLIGADTYPHIPTWRDSKNFDGSNFNGTQLMKEFPLIIFPRKGFDLPSVNTHRKQGFAKLSLLQNSNGLSPAEGTLSSTEVRKRIPLRKAQGLLPELVLEYIERGGLY